MTGIDLSDVVRIDETILSLSLPVFSCLKDDHMPGRGELRGEPDLVGSEDSDAAFDGVSSARWWIPKMCQLS